MAGRVVGIGDDQHARIRALRVGHGVHVDAGLRQLAEERRVRRRRERDWLGECPAQLDQPGHHVGHQRHLLGSTLHASRRAAKPAKASASEGGVGGA